MEIHSYSEHEGGEIVLNNSQFLITFQTADSSLTSPKTRYFYLFICPLTRVDERTGSPLDRSPFLLVDQGNRIQPAYLVEDGYIHYGFQISIVRNHGARFYVNLNLRNVHDLDQTSVFELVQVRLYDNSGDYDPIDLKYLVIKHPYTEAAPYFQPATRRFPPNLPVPYFQAPVTLPLTTHYSPFLTIGNTEHLFYGSFLPRLNQPARVVVKTRETLPHISYITKKYLRQSLHSSFIGEYWADLLFNFYPLNPGPTFSFTFENKATPPIPDSSSPVMRLYTMEVQDATTQTNIVNWTTNQETQTDTQPEQSFKPQDTTSAEPDVPNLATLHSSQVKIKKSNYL